MAVLLLYRKAPVFLICSLPVVATAGRVNDLVKPLALPLLNCTIPPNANFPDGVDSWGVQISIGSQQLCVVPSTHVNNTVITETEICTDDNTSDLAQCISRRGGTFDFRQADSHYNNISIQSLVPDPAWSSLNPPFSGAGNATIQFSSGITLPDFPIALASEGQHFSTNQLGLANDSVLLHSFASAGLSPALAFGLFAGSQSVAHPRDGQIVLGGYDSSLIDGPFTNYSINSSTQASDHACSLQVDVLKVSLRRPNLTDVEIQSEGYTMTYCIQP
jgi:hypothetical protein